MDSVKFPRRTTRIVEVEEYLKRLGATASAETAKEVVSGLSSGINEGAVLENSKMFCIKLLNQRTFLEKLDQV